MTNDNHTTPQETLHLEQSEIIAGVMLWFVNKQVYLFGPCDGPLKGRIHDHFLGHFVIWFARVNSKRKKSVFVLYKKKKGKNRNSSYFSMINFQFSIK